MSLNLLVILFWIACSGLVAQGEEDCEAFKLKSVQTPYEAAICTMVQDEGMYLLEWIEYHRLVGIEHFFLYNDRGTDNSEKILKPYIDAGVVTWINWDGNITNMDPLRAEPEPSYTQYQRYALADCIYERGHLMKYLGLWDIDEFVYFRTDKVKSVGSLIKDYMGPRGLTSLYVPATTFGPSNFNKRPTGLVTENYKWRSSLVAFGALANKTVGFSGKSFYRMGCAGAEVHHTAHPPGQDCRLPFWPEIVEENGVNLMPGYPVALKHYRSKSYEDFVSKTTKWGIGLHELGTWESFQKKHSKEYQIYDLDMMKFAERIKKAIQCNSKPVSSPVKAR